MEWMIPFARLVAKRTLVCICTLAAEATAEAASSSFIPFSRALSSLSNTTLMALIGASDLSFRINKAMLTKSSTVSG